MYKQKQRPLNMAGTVRGATGQEQIARMWKNHYAEMFNCVKSEVGTHVNLFYNTSTTDDIHSTICFTYL